MCRQASLLKGPNWTSNAPAIRRFLAVGGERRSAPCEHTPMTESCVLRLASTRRQRRITRTAGFARETSVGTPGCSARRPRAHLVFLFAWLAAPIPFAGVPWHRKPGFKLIAVKDVRRLTGLELSELLSRQAIQRLTRIDESGAREEVVRVPVELLIEEPAD